MGLEFYKKVTTAPQTYPLALLDQANHPSWQQRRKNASH